MSRPRRFGFNAKKQMEFDGFLFERVAPADREFWANFVDSQDDQVAARDVETLLSGPEVIELATFVAADRAAFRAPAYLVALLQDGSVLALRGTIGGMTLSLGVMTATRASRRVETPGRVGALRFRSSTPSARWAVRARRLPLPR